MWRSLGPLMFGLVVLSGCSGSGGTAYPDGYFLSGSDVPTGMEIRQPTSDEWPADWGSPSNPFKLPSGALRDEGISYIGIYGPSELWGQIVTYEDPRPDENSDFLILVGQWDEVGAADRARTSILADLGRAACESGGRYNGPHLFYLQDKSAIVLVATFDIGSHSGDESVDLLFTLRALTGQVGSLTEFLRACLG
jgi:hypothetical protein